MSTLAKLPDSILIQIFLFLVGERRKSFTIKHYQVDLLNLFTAEPRIFVHFSENPTFHLPVRGGVEENIALRLAEEPGSVDEVSWEEVIDNARDVLLCCQERRNEDR